MSRHVLYAMCLAIVCLAGCSGTGRKEAPVTLAWEMGKPDVEPGYYENSFIIRNVSDKPLSGEWTVYFNQLPRRIRQADTAAVKVEAVNANYFRMYPTRYYRELPAGDSLRVTFRCTSNMKKISYAPEGVYFVAEKDGQEECPLPVKMQIRPFTGIEGIHASFYPEADRVYARNERIDKDISCKEIDIFPSLKQVDEEDGVLSLNGTISLTYDSIYAGEAALLKEKLEELYGLTVAQDGEINILLTGLAPEEKPVNDEYYRLEVKDGGVKIVSHTAHGIFNGTQTLLALLKGQKMPYELGYVTITDYPDLPYRGMMMDIARNFTKVEDLKKLVDLLASYKVNVLHFHFTDDEGWRLEIPGLEELTAVGARRGHTRDEAECLYPAYGGGSDPDDPAGTGNGFYTREEFIDLLRFASARHIRVIPEIESPGHARAAIVAMNARYRKYAGEDLAKATEYLLCDEQDTSRYVSAQAYTDNIMNVALPSTYRFLEKVTGEVAAMYRDAGVPLTTIHLGGDEVPRGSWAGSPRCQELMAKEGMKNIHELTEYYLRHAAEILQRQGLMLSGWQEIALGHSEETDRYLHSRTAGVYCWHTVPEWSGDEIPYSIANNGYPVILCNVNNFYIDLAYDYHPDEPGPVWGGCVNEESTFSMLPYEIYRSARTNIAGRPVDTDKAGEGKENLTPDARTRIAGVQAQLFAEMVRDYAGVEYRVFPKILGLAERGWNARPEWSELQGEKEKETYDRSLSLFYTKIAAKEIPYWEKRKVNYRLPYPGIRVKDGLLYMNAVLPGAEIRYTTDGSEPMQESRLWESPVPADPGIVKARLFCGNKESVTAVLKAE